MLNSSLRHVARTCPNASVPTRHATTSQSSKSIAAFSTRCHQRRYSSSKPPIPPKNGSPSIPAGSVKQVGAPISSEKRAGTETRLSKRKVARGEKVDANKETQETKSDDWTLTFPSVPSTQHLNPKDIWVASFFSTHRPTSISGPLPPETQIEDFDKIFQLKPKRSRNGPADVIYTLSSAVQNLDENIQRGHQNTQQQNEQQIVEQKADLIKMLTQHNTGVVDGNQTTHLDGQPQRIQNGNVKYMIQELARQFRPFHAPPAPVPAPEVDLLGKDLDAQPNHKAEQEITFELELEQQDGQRTILQLNNLKSSKTDIRSGQFFTSRPVISNPISTVNISDPSKQPSKGGRLRRGMYVDPRKNLRNLKYYAISVKRQRKLKMKKHKYKKLMRKTRNLRRRHDKL